MPDPERRTISATQAPALFNVSPYYTRWMLWQHFANGLDIERPADARMRWGTLLQPLVLQQAAAELRLEVIPNAGDTYHRRGLLGCTRDATIVCPDRGPGALETKCVFDYRAWMADWEGGKRPPRRHEIQLQQQMLVGGDEFSEVGEDRPYRWGVLVAWVAGELHYFEREPIPDLWTRLEEEAAGFFRSIQARAEPEPFGAPVELPWLTALFPIDAAKTVPGDDALGELARAYRNAKDQESAGARTAEPLRAKLLAHARDAAAIELPGGMWVRIRPHGKGKAIKVYVPEYDAPEGVPSDLLMAG